MRSRFASLIIRELQIKLKYVETYSTTMANMLKKRYQDLQKYELNVL